MKKRTFLLNAIVLTASAIILRTTNIGYRVFIADKIGAAGIGLYQLIMSVFILAITICTSGISLAVTRLVAESLGKNQPGYAKSAVLKCMAVSLTLSFLAAGGLLVFADPIAAQILNDSRAAVPLKILAPSLPFMAISSCFRGYFIARRKAAQPSIADMLEQFSTIGISVALFLYFAPDGLESACCAITLGSTAGELISCLYNCIVYKLSIRPYRKYPAQSTGVLRMVSHIALPAMAGYTARNVLSAIENVLIPSGLKKHGAGPEASLAQYGMIQGMVMPLLYFPSAFLTSLSSLLVPEMAEANVCGKHRTIERTTCRAMQLTLLFSFFVTAVFLAFSKELGLAFYKNEDAGAILRIMAPLVPLMYLDSVVDGILKGLDQQLSSLKYNFSDSAFRVILVYLCIPVWGVKGYLGVLFFSTIYNASLSIHRLIKVSRVEVRLGDWVFKPALCAAVAVLTAMLPFRSALIPSLSPWQSAAAQIVLSGGLYWCFLRLCGSLSRDDIHWMRGLFAK